MTVQIIIVAPSYEYLWSMPPCSTFKNNVGVTGGIIGMPYVPVVMDGHNVFTKNSGATLRVCVY